MSNITPVFVPHNDPDYDHDGSNNNIYTKENNCYSRNYISSSSSSVQRVIIATIFFAAISFGCFFFLSSFNPRLSVSEARQPSDYSYSQVTSNANELNSILEKASMKDDSNKTVIMTILNGAWSDPNSIFDLFLESFRIGDDTEGLLKHLVVICMDEIAYSRCLALQLHCYQYPTNGVNFTNDAHFMSPNYVEIVGRKIEFLSQVLEMGYSFVFTDNDIMWLRNPFPHFFPEEEFLMSCDEYHGKPYDPKINFPNTGFLYVKLSPRTIQFFKYWYFSIKTFQNLHDQNAFNMIKFDLFIKFIGLRIRFLETTYFGGFCQPSKDLNLVCTMHANCCAGLKKKIKDLSILLQDWKRFKSSQPILNSTGQSPWSVPKNCRL